MTNRMKDAFTRTAPKKPRKVAPDISDLGDLWNPDDEVKSTQLARAPKGEHLPQARGRLAEHVKLVPIESVFFLHVDKEGRMHHPRTSHNPISDEDLRDSIREHGILQPLIVRPTSGFDSRDYEGVKGSRRFFAAKELGLTEIPVIVRNVTREQAVTMSYIMTAHQEQLPLADRAGAIMAIYDAMSNTLGEWLKVLHLTDKKGEPMLLTEQQMRRVTSEGMKQEQPHLPHWVIRVLENAYEKGRRPKVGMEEMERHIGLTRERIHQLRRAAEVPSEILQLAADEGDTSTVNSLQSSALAALRDYPALQKELAKKIKRENLTGNAALGVARHWVRQAEESTTFKESTPIQANQGTVPTANGISMSRKATDVSLPNVLPTADPLEQLQRGTAIWAEAAALLEKGRTDAAYRKKVLREVDTMELQLKRLRKVLQ